MKKIKTNLFSLLYLLIILVSPRIALANDRSTFPNSRMGGGTRGQCSSRLIIHIVPLANKYSPDNNRLLAIYLGKSKETKPLTVEIINDSHTEEKLIFDPSGESFLIFKTQTIANNTFWKSYFNCSENQSDNMINFISNNSNPVSTLILSKNNLENKKYQTFINKAYKQCGTTITRKEIKNLTNLDERISNKLSEKINIICP